MLHLLYTFYRQYFARIFFIPLFCLCLPQARATHTIKHPSRVARIFFSLDGSKIGTICCDPNQSDTKELVSEGVVRVFNTQDFNLDFKYKHPGASKLAFSYDGKFVASWSPMMFSHHSDLFGQCPMKKLMIVKQHKKGKNKKATAKKKKRKSKKSEYFLDINTEFAEKEWVVSNVKWNPKNYMVAIETTIPLGIRIMDAETTEKALAEVCITYANHMEWHSDGELYFVPYEGNIYINKLGEEGTQEVSLYQDHIHNMTFVGNLDFVLTNKNNKELCMWYVRKLIKNKLVHRYITECSSSCTIVSAIENLIATYVGEVTRFSTGDLLQEGNKGIFPSRNGKKVVVFNYELNRLTLFDTRANICFADITCNHPVCPSPTGDYFFIYRGEVDSKCYIFKNRIENKGAVSGGCPQEEIFPWNEAGFVYEAEHKKQVSIPSWSHDESLVAWGDGSSLQCCNLTTSVGLV